MDLKQLEAFVHVAQLGSFTRAATILDTTQPALSRLVRQLELELRQNLLKRNGRGVVMSDAGQMMLAHAQGILSQVERATQDLQKLRGTVGGHFSIGLTPSAARIATLELVRGFRARFPSATISVAEGLSTYLIEWLMMGRIDAAVLYDTAQTPLIAKRAVVTEELFLFGRFDAGPDSGLRPARHPVPDAGRKAVPESIRIQDIGQYPLVIPGRMHAIRHIVESRAVQAGAKLAIALEVDAVTSILDLVCDGYGYAVLPLTAATGDPLKRRFRIRRITDPTPFSQLTIATSSQHTLSHLATQAIAMVEQEVLPLYTDARHIGQAAVG